MHVEDYCDAIEIFINAPKEKVANEIFNVGFENMSIMQIAQIVKKVVERDVQS